MLVKIKQKIRCGIGAEGDDSSADLFQNLKKMFEKSNKVFYNEIEIIYNKIVKLYPKSTEDNMAVSYNKLWKLMIDKKNK